MAFEYAGKTLRSSAWKILPSASAPRPICAFRRPRSESQEGMVITNANKQICASTRPAAKLLAMHLKK